MIASGPGIDNLYSVALQPDGKILVVGYSVNGSSYDLTVLRLAADGTLDGSFGTGGRATLSLNSYAIGESIAVQPDGKIVVAGFASNGVDLDFLVVRFTSAGSVDPDFGGGSPVLTPIGGAEDTGRAVALQSDGKIVVVGNSFGADHDFAVVRLLDDGSLDPAFGTAGKVVTAIGPDADTAFGIGILADGRIVAGGSTGTFTESSFALARYENVIVCPVDTDGDGICDPTDVCPGVADPDQADSDGDGLGDACDVCTTPDAAGAGSADLQISRLRFSRGSQDMRFSGRFQPFPSTPAVDPLADGLRLVLQTATGRVVLDATLPAGPYSAASRIGWKSRVSKGKTIHSWAHTSSSIAPPGGIVSATVTVDASGLPDVQVVGKKFDYTVDPGEEQLRFTLVARPAVTPAAQCGDMVNGLASGGPTCQFRDTGRTLRCR